MCRDCFLRAGRCICTSWGTKRHHSVPKSPVPKGCLLIVRSRDRLSFTGLLWDSRLRCGAEFPFVDLYCLGIFVMVTWGPFFFFFYEFFFWILKAASFSSLHMYKLFLVLLGIANVKHSVTFGNINKPLKVHVQLDSLTCCPEVEASLTWEAFYGLNSSGKTIVFLLTFVLPVSLAVFLGAVEKQGAPF